MFCYVILHYQNFEVTKKCVQTLLKSSLDSELIIVDNCSPNGSGKKLKECFSDVIRVTVILNYENVGFAKGNNVGYEFAKKMFMPDYMVVMNNDIMIKDSKFEAILKKYMIENGVDVAGPDIVTLKNSHQNPLAYAPMTSKYLRRRIIFDKIKCVIFKNDFIFLLYMLYKKRHPVPIKKKSSAVTDCLLHGSCVVFGIRYISSEYFAFLPITYMYNEEAILSDYLKYRGYRTGYCDRTYALHLEGISTTERMKDNKEKIIFRFKNNTDSLCRQLKEREKYLKG